MKTIAELQQEIRSIRKDISEMDARLASIDEELSQFKDSMQKDNSIYKNIYRLAETMKRYDHPMTHLSNLGKSTYFNTVFMVATIEDSLNDSQLLFLQRMIMADTDRMQIDSYIGQMEKLPLENTLLNLTDEVINTLPDELLLDVIIIANLSNHCTDRSWSVIADIAAIMGRNRRKMQRIGSVAAAILTKSLERIEGSFNDILEYNQKYSYYLQEITGWEEMVEKAKKEEKIFQQKEDDYWYHLEY